MVRLAIYLQFLTKFQNKEPRPLVFLKHKESFDTRSIRDQNLTITNMESLRRRCLFQLVNGIPEKELVGIPQKEVHCIYI